MSTLTVFMVECSYVIQIIFGKNKDDTGTVIASPSHLFKFCPSDLLGLAPFKPALCASGNVTSDLL